MFKNQSIKSTISPLGDARFWVILALGVVIMLTPVIGHAFDASQVRVNGFASQTYIESEGNNFLVSDSEEGSLQLNEVGITFNAPVSENLRIGAQLLSRDFGSEGNNEVDLDWGFGDYHFRDWLGIRIGKVKLPNGLHNEGRDSDFLRETVLLPQSIYPEERRTFGVSVNGMGLYGNASLGAAGDLDYDLVIGEVNVKSDAKMITDQVPLMNAVWGMLLGGAPTNAEKLEVDSDGVITGRLVYNTPINGLRAAYGFQNSKATLSGVAAGFVVGNIEFQQKDTETISLEYSAPSFSLQTEYRTYNQITDISAVGSPASVHNDTNPEGVYFMATYHIPGPSRLSVSGIYDISYYDKDDHNGQYVSSGIDYTAWRKDTGIALRYDVTDNFILKAEYHDVNGVFGLSSVDNAAGFDEDWSYSMLKASFVF